MVAATLILCMQMVSRRAAIGAGDGDATVAEMWRREGEVRDANDVKSLRGLVGAGSRDALGKVFAEVIEGGD